MSRPGTVRARDPYFRETPPKLGTMTLAVSVLAFVLVFATAADYGLASDVANYFASSLRQLDWARFFFERLLEGRPTDGLSREPLLEAWRWYPERIPHPPLSRELSGVGWLLGHEWLDTLTAYRLAAMLGFALLTGWVTTFTYWALRSRVAGLTAGLSVIAYPVLFAHGHFAHTDLFLAGFWFASAAALAVFERTRRIGWLIATGLLFGAAAATKFSGLLLGPVIAVWLLIRRPREAVPAMIVVALAAVTLFVLVNPVMWVEPGLGLADYFRAGTERATDSMTRLRTEYFGRIYVFRPPVHYPWVWTLLVIPPSLLAAMAIGLVAFRRTWVVGFCLLNMAALYGAFLLPGAPMHDGVRLFLPVLPFQCVLAGVGVWSLAEALGSRVRSVGRPWLEALLLVVVVAPAASANVGIHPYQLSYVTPLAGGVAGADARGLEVTNLKEVLSPSVLVEIDSVTPPGAVVDPGFMTEEVCFYRSVYGLATDWVIHSPVVDEDGARTLTLTCRPDELLPRVLDGPARDPDVVLVLNREAMWRPVDRALFHHAGSPAYELRLDGVPLLRAYRTD